MRRLLMTTLCGLLLVVGIQAQSPNKQEQMRSLLTYAVRANHFNALYPLGKVYLHFDNAAYFSGV